MQESNPELTRYFEALASEKRLQVLDWLSDPEAHFRPQVDGDLVKDGETQSHLRTQRKAVHGVS